MVNWLISAATNTKYLKKQKSNFFDIHNSTWFTIYLFTAHFAFNLAYSSTTKEGFVFS